MVEVFDLSHPFTEIWTDAQVKSREKDRAANKGKKPAKPPDRHQLVSESIELLECAESMKHPYRQGVQGHFQTIITSPAYPPSTVPLDRLRKMKVEDLRMETRHPGKVLIVRTFTEPNKRFALFTYVEDEDGGVDRLEVGFEDPSIEPQHFFPNGQVLAIKEPYYSFKDGECSIRVEHPSDLIHLQPADPVIPPSLAPSLKGVDRSPEDWKNCGNRAWVTRDYQTALKMYTRGIEAGATAALMSDLYRNRAIVNIRLQRFELAQADARTSIIATTSPVSGQASKNNTKALFRAGRAAYELGNFDRAQEDFMNAIRLSPDDLATRQELQRTEQRILEAKTGTIDFAAATIGLDRDHCRVDCASFTTNVEVRDAGPRGRGLFAKKALKAGELVLCEKAFDFALRSEDVKDIDGIVNATTVSTAMGLRALLFLSTIQKLRNNPQEALRFLALHDGDYSPKCTAEQVDGTTVIDTFQVFNIIEKNAFDFRYVVSADGSPMLGSQGRDELRSSGVWITLSYVNHACDGNAYRSVIGDLVILRAGRDIKEGEEITMSYLPTIPFSERNSVDLELVWGFDCDCRVCTAQSKSSRQQRERRTMALAEIQGFLAAHPMISLESPGFINHPEGIRIVGKAEKLYQQMEATYDARIHDGLPRLGLVRIGSWLIQACSKKDSAFQEMYGLNRNMLRNLGFAIDTDGDDTVPIDRTHGVICFEAITAARYIALFHQLWKKREMEKKFEGFAERRWLALYGSMHGYEASFGGGMA